MTRSIGRFIIDLRWCKSGLWDITQKKSDDVFACYFSIMKVTRGDMSGLQIVIGKLRIIMGVV